MYNKHSLVYCLFCILYNIIRLYCIAYLTLDRFKSVRYCVLQLTKNLRIKKQPNFWKFPIIKECMYVL